MWVSHEPDVEYISSHGINWGGGGNFNFNIFLPRERFIDRREIRVAVISAKNHKHQRRKRQSVNAKREKLQTPKVLTAILTLPNLT